MAKRRQFTVFSLSFLDVMSCGFGAVILIFLILNHETEADVQWIKKDLLSEARRLDYEIDVGKRDLATVQNELEDTLKQVDDERKRRLAILEDAERKEAELDALKALTEARVSDIVELQSDIDTREDEVKRLQELERQQEARAIIEVEGEGDRQYLTGLYMGGEHILIALDASASMLAESIVNVLRRRHMSYERKLASPKWQRALATVSWLTAQIPVESHVQIVTFNTALESIFENKDWVAANESDRIDAAIGGLSETTPENGTNLSTLVDHIANMDPPPDNVFLIIDSLPTQSSRSPRKAVVTGPKRFEYFREAVEALPRGIPINIIMFPMEGDPQAAAAYWNLARITAGTYMSPSRDWP